MSSRPVVLIGVAACVASAMALRVWGIGQGYPDFYGHVDEIGVAASIWNFFREGTLRPTEFTYPALYQYMVAAAIGLAGVAGLVGPESGGIGQTLQLVSFTDPAFSALVGRSLSAVMSTLSVLVVFQLGREAFDARTGLTAALFAGFSTIPVTLAHRALPDSSMAFFAAACMLYSWRAAATGSWRHYALAACAAGLTMATKYNGGLVSLGLVAAHISGGLMRRRRLVSLLVDVKLLASVAIAFAALFAASPYLILAREQYAAVAQYQISSLDFTMGDTSPWWWIPRDIGTHEGLMGVLMVIGVGWSLVRRRPLDWIFLAAFVPSFLYIGSWTRESLHYLVHFYPVLALGAARVVVALSAPSASKPAGRWRPVAAYALLALCIIPNARDIISSNRDLTLTDTRALAGEWIQRHVPAGATIAMTWLPYCPRIDLEGARRSVRGYFGDNTDAQSFLTRIWKDRSAYRLVNLEVWLKRPLVPEAYRGNVDLDDPETRRIFSRAWWPLGQLREQGVEFVVLPAAAYERYTTGAAPEAGTAAHYRYVANGSYFTSLMSPNSGLELVAEFKPGQGPEKTRGGGIRIYRIT